MFELSQHLNFQHYLHFGLFGRPFVSFGTLDVLLILLTPRMWCLAAS